MDAFQSDTNFARPAAALDCNFRVSHTLPFTFDKLLLVGFQLPYTSHEHFTSLNLFGFKPGIRLPTNFPIKIFVVQGIESVCEIINTVDCLSVSVRGEFNKTLDLSRVARRMDGHWSGKGAALLPLPPLRTGRESFPSSGSSRNKAPRERSRLHDGLIPACWRVMPNFFWNARSAK